MKIELASLSDTEKIKEIYASAREFMKKSNNEEQWGEDYPSDSIISDDINKGRLFTVKQNGELLAVFCFFEGRDNDYEQIYGGEWQGREPYGVMHRVAVAENAHGRGVVSFCFSEIMKKCSSIRIDTHINNIPMQKALLKNGFSRRGRVYVEGGKERIGYERLANQKNRRV